MKANQNNKFHVEGLREFLWNTDPQTITINMQLTEGDSVTAERHLPGSY